MKTDPRTPMRTIEGEVRKNNFEVFLLGYTQEEAQKEAARCYKCRKPLCRQGCPIENRIPEFMKEVEDGNFAKAYEILMDKTCMPAICGTVCPHEDQCEGSCVHGKKGQPIAIGSVERFVAEWAEQNGLCDKVKPESNGHKVACVGAGPASMACAQKLGEKGYELTVFEKQNYKGGVLGWGIPSYRLGAPVVQNAFRHLDELGVKFELDSPVSNVAELKDKGYEAVFLGIGACLSNAMNIPGEDLKGVYASNDYLTQINLDEIHEDGRRHFNGIGGTHVLVVGGGNVAMDAARDSIRLAQNETTTIVYRRSEQEMPAATEELNHAKEEGVVFQTLTNPVAFIGDENGYVKQAECAIMKLGEPDASGRRRPIESDEPHLFIDVDTVVLALGFSNDPDISAHTEGLDADKWGCFLVDDDQKTSLPYVFAGGDAVTGAQTVVKAMKAGMKAAVSIDEYFNK